MQASSIKRTKLRTRNERRELRAVQRLRRVSRPSGRVAWNAAHLHVLSMAERHRF